MSTFGVLYVVATPIGNLEDITLRALRILREVDVILCEDTRVTKKLLERYEIQKPLLSYHQHSHIGRVEEICVLLKQGKSIALVSDAGTPGISDPGNELIHLAIQRFGDLAVVPIPGPSAVSAIASVAGIPMQRFYFAGYPPQKKGRKAFFAKLAEIDAPSILFESPHRIARTLSDVRAAYGDTARVVIGRELTKKFETLYRGTCEEVALRLAKEKPRGEFVLIVQKEKRPA